jgi:dolichol-phosphate mannosyltransferase
MSAGQEKMASDSAEGGLGPVLILVCTYNELANLPSLIDRIEQVARGCDVLVIDDQSPDGTPEWLSAREAIDPGLRFIVRGGKLGLGSAIRDGLAYALEQGYSWVVNLDADWSHEPSAIQQLLARRVVRGQLQDLVIGSRYVAGGGLKNCSWRRHLVSRAANLYTRLLLGMGTRDCSSAFRCYRMARFNRQDLGGLKCKGYGFLEEILWYLRGKGARIQEVPIVYTEREKGDSKISMREAWGTATTVLRLALRRWPG